MFLKRITKQHKAVKIMVLIMFIGLGLNDFSYTITNVLNMPEPVQSLLLPYRIGKIADRYNKIENSGRDLEDIKVYIIKNVHCHRDAQEKISGIIRYIKENFSGKLITAGIEGSCGEIDTSCIGTIGHKIIRERIINYLLDQGKLNGAELYTLKYPNQKVLKKSIRKDRLLLICCFTFLS